MKREAPKNVRSRNPKWAEEARELRGNPGEWFVLTEFPVDPNDPYDNKPRHLANGITMGKLKSFRPAGHFKGVSRKNREEGVIKVHARYVGDLDG
jgi:hypothetical protein